MAQPIATYSDWLGELSQPAGSPITAPGLTTSYGNAGDMVQTPPAPTGQATASAPVGTQVQPSAPAPAPQQQPAQQQQQPEGSLTQFSLSTQAPSDGAYSDLFGQTGQQLQQLGGRFGEALQGFQQAVGTGRTFEDLGGADILGQAVETGEGMDAAGDLLNARYTGPMGLDSTLLGETQSKLGSLDALISPDDSREIQTLVQKFAPQLTAGQARFEARRLREDPRFQEEAKVYEDMFQELSKGVKGGAAQASALGATRQQQEVDIAQKSRDLLTGRRDEIGGAVGGRVDTARQEQQQAENLWNQYHQTGDVNHLVALEQLVDPDKAQASSDYQAKLDAIMADPRFASLADVPQMVANEGLGSALRMDADWYEQAKGKYGKAEMDQLKSLARERQKAIGELGDKPYSAADTVKFQKRAEEAQTAFTGLQEQFKDLEHMPLMDLAVNKYGRQDYVVRTPEGESIPLRQIYKTDRKQYDRLLERQNAFEKLFGHEVDPTKAKKARRSQTTAEGKFRDVLPLYDEAGQAGDVMSRLWKPTDPRAAVNFDIGARPSRHNMASQEERERFNRIAQMLGSNDRIQEAQVGYDPGDISASIADLFSAEQGRLSERDADLDAAQDAFRRRVVGGRAGRRAEGFNFKDAIGALSPLANAIPVYM